MFFNTLTADDKYSRHNRDNLTQPIRTILCQKQKAFSIFFLAFSQFTLNFEIFQKKMTLIADLFPKLCNTKNVVRYLSKKSNLKGPLEGQHGKRIQTLLRSERQQRYHI